MPDLLADLGSALPGWVLGMTLWTAALLFVAAIADRVLARRVRPALRIALYGTVFVRLALPVDWHSPVALVPGDDARPATVTTAPAIEIPLLAVDRPDPGSIAVPAQTRGWTTAHALALGHVGGACLLLGLLVVGRIRLGHRLRTATAARPRLARLAARIEIREHDSEGPLTFGVLRPVIVIPGELVDALSDEELRHVVAHEFAHVRRRDPVLVLALALAVVVAWPVVPVWLAAGRIRQLVEQAADEHSLVHGGIASARAYGRTLLALAARRPSSASAAALHLGGFRDLRGRIAALGHRRRAPGPVQAAAILGIASAALACAGTEGDADPEIVAARCAALLVDATTLHDEAERTNAPPTRRSAAEAYDTYASECATHPDYAEALYYRAELLWSIAVERHRAGDHDGAREAFGTAHIAFNAALAEEPTRFTKDAAYAQLTAKRSELGVQLGPLRQQSEEPQRGPAKFPRSEYTAEELELLASYDTYEHHVADPDDEELQRVRYHRAHLAMRHNRFDEAKPILVELLSTSDGTDVHAWAAELLYDVLVIAWTDPDASAEARGAAAAELEHWLRRFPELDFYQLEAAEKLRDGIPKILAGLEAQRAAP
jgi:beta-lactamase regulating signal transducer with metallopeptidase domain